MKSPVPNPSLSAEDSVLLQELETAKALLYETEQRFLIAEENARTGIWDFDAKTGLTYLSPGWASMVGLPLDKTPKSWAEWASLLHPEDLERVRTSYYHSMQDPTIHYEQEFRMLHADGRYRWILSRAKPLTDERGTVRRMVGVHIDITSLKDIHDQMREQERNFEEVSALLPFMMSITDANGKFLFTNAAWTQYTGMTADEIAMANTNWLQVIHPSDRKLMEGVWKKTIQEKEPAEIDVRIQRYSDGLYRWHHCVFRPLRIKNGAIERWYFSANDIQDSKNP